MSDPQASDAACQRPPSEQWKVAAASVQGASHEKTGVVCQDSHRYARPRPEILVAAISDGAGSASKAEIGSQEAAARAVEALCDLCAGPDALPGTEDDWSHLMRGVMASAREAVEAKASALSVPARELACTLIALLATPSLVVAAQIGDGAAVVGDQEGSLTALTVPQSGEYLNETTFIIAPQAVEQVRTTVWRGEAAFLAAFSDGLQMLALKMNEGTPHAPFFTPLFQFIREQEDMEEAERQLRAFLISPRILQRADDDLTLLLAHWPR